MIAASSFLPLLRLYRYHRGRLAGWAGQRALVALVSLPHGGWIITQARQNEENGKAASHPVLV
jgi:hypothetical protein